MALMAADLRPVPADLKCRAASPTSVHVEYRLRILAECDGLPEPGAKGAAAAL